MEITVRFLLTTICVVISSQAMARGALVHKAGDADQPTAGSYFEAVLTPVSFGTIEYDTDGFFDGRDTIIIPPGVSRVRLECTLAFEPNPNGYRQAAIRKNGAMYPGYATDNRPAVAGTDTVLAARTPVLLVKEGDRFQCEAWHLIDKTMPSISVKGLGATWFSIEVLD